MKNALRVGAALAATVVIAYSACTALFLLFPGLATSFMTALFHGIDFAPIKTSHVGWSGFFFAACVLTGWAFAVGALFSAVRGLFDEQI